jgi:DNA-binding response OmpR family regulator
MNEHILIVDDDTQITAFLERYLQQQQFRVSTCGSAKEMRRILASEAVDLCVLDINLPDADGFELTKEIRRQSNLPIIVLSVRDETFDRIFGLEFGADDYVTKPFEPRELVARIRTVLRRTRIERLASFEADAGNILLQVDAWIINITARTVTHQETKEDADLTAMEFDFLKALAEHPRTVLSRDQLLDFARGTDAIVGDRTVDVHIMRLRKKIEADPGKPSLVKTIHGIGYCLATDVTRLKVAR